MMERRIMITSNGAVMMLTGIAILMVDGGSRRLKNWSGSSSGRRRQKIKMQGEFHEEMQKIDQTMAKIRPTPYGVQYQIENTFVHLLIHTNGTSTFKPTSTAKLSYAS